MERSSALSPSSQGSSFWPRLHLFELTDQAWRPRALRDHLTDYLATVVDRMGIFDPAADVIARGLEASGSDEVLDLASGGGGPLARLRPLVERKLGRSIRVRQSDKFPNVRAAERAQAARLETWMLRWMRCGRLRSCSGCARCSTRSTTSGRRMLARCSRMLRLGVFPLVCSRWLSFARGDSRGAVRATARARLHSAHPAADSAAAVLYLSRARGSSPSSGMGWFRSCGHIGPRSFGA